MSLTSVPNLSLDLDAIVELDDFGGKFDTNSGMGSFGEELGDKSKRLLIYRGGYCLVI